MPPGVRAPLVVLLVVVLVLAAATPSRAEPTEPRASAAPHARLVYFVDPTATGCPTSEEFLAAVDARAGHELFGEPSDLTIDVTLRRLDAAYVATVAVPDTATSPGATRELRSEAGCAELAAAAALVTSIALDPESILRPSPPAPAPPAPAPRSWRYLLGAGPRVAWGLTPRTTAGLALSGEAASGRTAVGVELAGFLPNDARLGRGSVSVLPVTLSVLPCAMAAHLSLCAVARLGLLRGTGAGYEENDTTWKAFAAAGLRGGAFLDVGRARLRAFAEGTGVAPTTRFVIDETAAYETRGVSFVAGLDVLLFF